MIGIPHDVRPADIDESYLPGEPPLAHAERLAREKGAVIAEPEPGAVVIASDTIVVIDDDVLGKPQSDEDAVRMLARLSGRTHTVFTAVAVSWRGRMESGVEVVAVTFRALDEATIRAYVATGEPMDKAGAYGIQGFGAAIVERIDGDYFAVMGLAIGRMLTLLRRLGIHYGFGSLETGSLSVRAPEL
jgi:septum formation protein